MAGTKARMQSEAPKVERVKLPANLFITKTGIYKYRKVVPADVRHIIKKTEFKESLGGDRRLALVRHAELEAENTQLIYAARQQIDVTMPKHRPRTDAEAMAQFKKKHQGAYVELKAGPDVVMHLAGLYYMSLENDLAARRSGQDSEHFAALTTSFEWMHKMVVDAVVTGDVSGLPALMNQTLNFDHYEVLASKEEWQKMAYSYAVEIRPAVEELLRRQSGIISSPDLSKYAGKILGPAWMPEKVRLPAPEPVAPPQIYRLSDVIPHYAKYNANLAPKTRSTRLSCWNRLVEFCQDKPVADVTTADLYAFFESRLNAPDNDNWTMDTCKKAKREFETAFGLAMNQNMTHVNVAVDVRVMPNIDKEEEKQRKKPRFPFNFEKLNIFFASEWYDPDSESFRDSMKMDLSARYWVPLIGLFHGLRVREATQICVHDISSAEGHPLLTVQVELGPKASTSSNSIPARTIKNETTHRTIPVHPKLVELGFSDLVADAARRGPYAPLFPSSLPEPKDVDKRNDDTNKNDTSLWGRAFEQKFLRWVRDSLKFGRGYGFHSFRHSIEDAMRNDQLSDEGQWPAGLSDYYTGRSQPNARDEKFFKKMGSASLYGDGFNPVAAIRFINRLQYPEVTLPRPYKQWLNGRISVDERIISKLDKAYGNTWR